jgi:hypothetical protein
VAAERQRERADDHDEHFQHAVIVAVLSPKFNSDEFWRASRWLTPVEPAGAPPPDHEVVFLLNFFDELR